MIKTTLDYNWVERSFTLLENSPVSSHPLLFHQPIHVLYGGADRFSADTVKKLGGIALNAFTSNAATVQEFADIFGISDDQAERVFNKVKARLIKCPIEDFRIDFEDGFGIRSDAEEDDQAIRTASETANAMVADALPPYFGIRIKSFSRATYQRAVRTLDIFFTRLIESAHHLPDNFVVTLPKVEQPSEVRLFSELLDRLELDHGLANGSIKIEIMVETPQALMNANDVCPLTSMVQASGGRCRGAHFGAYDYMSSLTIASSSQELTHQSCDNARNIMQLALGPSGVWLSDGATNIMPIGEHRKKELTLQQVEANRRSVAAGWMKHFENCKHSVQNGYRQGWDLHPAQIPARLTAVYQYYLNDLETSAIRLQNFVENATKASLAGVIFDDAATGQGLINFFIGALDCDAINDDELLSMTGITSSKLRCRSFAKLIEPDDQKGN